MPFWVRPAPSDAALSAWSNLTRPLPHRCPRRRLQPRSRLRTGRPLEAACPVRRQRFQCRHPRKRLKAQGLGEIEVVHGTAGTVRVSTHPEVDFVVSAIVGVAGLEATYEAVKAGKTSARQQRMSGRRRRAHHRRSRKQRNLCFHRQRT